MIKIEKTYKQKYKELLLKQHEKKYIHFSWSTMGRLFAFLGSLGLSIVNFYLLVSIGKVFKVWELLSSGKEELGTAYISFSQLIILYPLIGEYLLIGLSVICLTALIKGGFKKLKKYWDNGLILGIIWGVIWGIIVGIIVGIIWGLINGIICGIILGIILGIINEW